MSGIGSSQSSSGGGSTVYGNNVAPISFPGIASGIDYNSIITKYTNLTLAAGDAAAEQGHGAERASRTSCSRFRTC